MLFWVLAGVKAPNYVFDHLLLTLINGILMNTMESSAVVALSNHYIPLYGFIFNHVMSWERLFDHKKILAGYHSI